MTKNIVVHTTDVSGDGIGDLIYLLNWLKVFHRYYKGTHQQLVIIFADDMPKVTDYILSLKEIEPAHPLFNFFIIADSQIKPILVDSVKIGSLIKPNSPMAMLDIRHIFPHIKEQDVVNIFTISVSGNMLFKNLEKRVRVNKHFGIFEFDAIPQQIKTPTYSTLGLGPHDLGLLHDLDGITGMENIEDYLQKISPATKKLIFQNEGISIADAKSQLVEVPSVFAYLFPWYDTVALEAALNSPIIQKAIEQGKIPLFFITNLHEGIKLPLSMQEAANKGKIRIVSAWIRPAEFINVNAIFMNQSTNSIVIPSGDNTLTACIKVGKFPLYAHKQLPDLFNLFTPKDSKLTIFRSMFKILNENATKYGWDKNPGFKECKRTLAYLSQATHNTEQARNTAHGLEMFITQEMLSFFRTALAPYIMENFAFEKRNFPAILSMIKATAEEKPKVTSSTVQFDALKAKPPTSKAGKDASLANEPNAEFAGFKPGFLKP